MTSDYQPGAAGRVTDIALHVVHTAAVRAQRGQHVLDVGARAHAADRQVPAVLGERARNAEADAARPAGHDRDRAWLSHSTPDPKKVRYGAPVASLLT